MKKIIAVVLMTVFIAIFSGCELEAVDASSVVASNEASSIILQSSSQAEISSKETSSEKTSVSSKPSAQIVPSSSKEATSSKNVSSDEIVSYAEKEEVSSKYNEPASSEQSAETQSRVVYMTPTGKRYHLDPDCGGKNSTATTLSQAIRYGLTPCKKCA